MAAFNRNVLAVINRELGGKFPDLEAFTHVARWNSAARRIERVARADAAQTVVIPRLDLTVEFTAG